MAALSLSLVRRMVLPVSLRNPTLTRTTLGEEAQRASRLLRVPPLKKAVHRAVAASRTRLLQALQEGTLSKAALGVGQVVVWMAPTPSALVAQAVALQRTPQEVEVQQAVPVETPVRLALTPQQAQAQAVGAGAVALMKQVEPVVQAGHLPEAAVGVQVAPLSAVQAGLEAAVKFGCGVVGHNE